MEYKTYDEMLSMLIVSKVFNENTAFNDFQKKLVINEIQAHSPFTLDNVTREKFFEYSMKGVLLPYAGKEIELGVRPEDVQEGTETALNVFSNENLGMNTLVHGHIGDNNRISAKLRGWYDYKNGDTVNVAFARKHFFDKESGVAIRKGAKA